MPVSFESPQPFSAQAAYGYGAFQRLQADRDFALRQRQLDLQQQGVSYQTAVGAAQTDNQAREAGAAQEERAREFDLARQPGPLDVFQARQQQQQVQERFELQAWLQGQELSQAEKVHLQRQQNAVGSLSQMHQDGQINDDEFYDTLAELRTGIDFGKRRLEQAQARQKQALAQQEIDRGHQQAAMTKAFEGLMTDGGPKTFPLQLPDGSQAVAYFANPRDGWKVHAPKPAAGAAAGGKPFDIAKAHKDAAAEATLAYPDDLPPDDAHPKWRASAEQMQRRNEWATKVFERERSAHRQAHGAGGSAQAPVPDQPDQPGGQQNPPPPGGGPPESPEARQRRVLTIAGRFQDQAARVEARPDLPPEKRAEYAAAFRRLQALAAAFGSPAEMPERYRKEAEKLAAVLAALPEDPRAAADKASRQQAGNDLSYLGSS